MKILNSWKLYVVVIAVGFVIWAAASILLVAKPVISEVPREILKSVPTAPAKSIYPEIKFWAETVGKILVGVGGVAGSIKALLELFRRRKND